MECHAGPCPGGVGVPQELGVIYPSVLALSFPPSGSWRLASQQRREVVAFLTVVLLYYNIYTLKMRNREGLGMKSTRLQHSSKKYWVRPMEGVLDPKLFMRGILHLTGMGLSGMYTVSGPWV